MNKRSKLWIAGYLILAIGILFAVGQRVVSVDPFFYYHKPDLSKYLYKLDNQRSQNDGILKHFDYDALITESSITENLKTTEMDDIFGTKSIKVSYSGGWYKEINDNLLNALRHNPDLKIIVRGLDMLCFLKDKDLMRDDLGKYPTYLYDDNILNDVQYIYNRDVVFRRVVPMVFDAGEEDFKSGITSFDEYSNWMAQYTFGRWSVCPSGIEAPEKENSVHLSEWEKKIVLGTVHQNITSLVQEHPDVTFYYTIQYCVVERFSR